MGKTADMAQIFTHPGLPVYQIKVTLAGSEPAIWRRFQVPESYTLHKLHKVLQIVMGWEECHLYEFMANKTSYGEPQPDYGDRMKSAKNVKISQIAEREKTKLKYIYDFGDGWQHELFVEKILPMDPGIRYPVCLAGQQACPPEDCGGIGGYGYFLDAINDPKHEEHKDLLEWIGGEFDPAAFDLERVNAELKRIR